MTRSILLGVFLCGVLGLFAGLGSAETTSATQTPVSIEERLAQANKDYNLAFRGLSPDGFEPVFAQFLALAQEGNAEAQETVGQMYITQQGVAFDRCEATYWWDKAARAGRAGAQARLGYSYWGGDGVIRDFDLAYLWLMTAAKNGDADAKKEAKFIAKSYIDDEQRVFDLDMKLHKWRAEDQPPAIIVRAPKIFALKFILAIAGLNPCHMGYDEI
ncbi:tetratricopeptide repeat protein [Insolitispirillum peregrinum]|uniref:tetratricopeptide repeat protein n=1 Tax=Insolitispirillum peregrinum TaxID=80876 RepID=UPI00360B8FF8